MSPGPHYPSVLVAMDRSTPAPGPASQRSTQGDDRVSRPDSRGMPGQARSRIVMAEPQKRELGNKEHAVAGWAACSDEQNKPWEVYNRQHYLNPGYGSLHVQEDGSRTLPKEGGDIRAGSATRMPQSHDTRRPVDRHFSYLMEPQNQGYKQHPHQSGYEGEDTAMVAVQASRGVESAGARRSAGHRGNGLEPPSPAAAVVVNHVAGQRRHPDPFAPPLSERSVEEAAW